MKLYFGKYAGPEGKGNEYYIVIVKQCLYFHGPFCFTCKTYFCYKPHYKDRKPRGSYVKLDRVWVAIQEKAFKLISDLALSSKLPSIYHGRAVGDLS